MCCSSEQTLSRKRKRQIQKSSEDLQKTDNVRTHSSSLHDVGSLLAKRVKKFSFSTMQPEFFPSGEAKRLSNVSENFAKYLLWHNIKFLTGSFSIFAHRAMEYEYYIATPKTKCTNISHGRKVVVRFI